MKGDLTIKILKLATEASFTPLEVFVAIGSAGYGASPGRINKKFEEIRETRKAISEKIEEEIQAKIRYQKLVHKLKKEGFLIEKKEKNRNILRVTQGGAKKLFNLIHRRKSHYTVPRAEKYSSMRSENICIVTFDIPESERRKRDWLRGVLKFLGFSMVQKSVWVGKIKIPGDLLSDLSLLKMMDFIQIFEVGKTGTLEDVT